MHLFKKIVVLDLDELIIPRMQRTYQEMLQYLETLPEAIRHPNNHRSYTFRNVYYFFELPMDESQPEKLSTQRHRAHVKPSGPGYSVKSIIDPYSCTNVHNHFCWRRAPKLNGQQGYNMDVDPQIGANQHYKKCHFKKEECEKMMLQYYIDDNMLKYGPVLNTNVNRVLKALHVI